MRTGAKLPYTRELVEKTRPAGTDDLFVAWETLTHGGGGAGRLRCSRSQAATGCRAVPVLPDAPEDHVGEVDAEADGVRLRQFGDQPAAVRGGARRSGRGRGRRPRTSRACCGVCWSGPRPLVEGRVGSCA